MKRIIDYDWSISCDLGLNSHCRHCFTFLYVP